MVSDLTPEETLRRQVRRIHGHDYVPFPDALAAVVAERERLGERLLSDEAGEAAEAHRWTYMDGTPGGSWANMPAALSAAWRVVTGSKDGSDQ